MALSRKTFAEFFSRKGLAGMTRDGDIDYILAGNSTPASNQLHIVHKGNVSTYTPTEVDDGAYMVFDYAGDMVITLPASLVADESDPFTMFVVNTLGRIDFVSETPLIAYAPHVAQYVTCGLIRGSVNWYASGTNNKEELS